MDIDNLCYKLDIDLTRMQKKYWEGIKWLIDEKPINMRTGRSLLLAVAFIYQAIERPNKKIYVFDHWLRGACSFSQQNMFWIIRSLIAKITDVKFANKFYFYLADYAIMYKEEK